VTEVAEERKEAHISREGGFADAPEHRRYDLSKENRHSARCSCTSPRVFLLRMVDICMHIARERPRAAGRVGGEPTARVHGEVGRLLHRLHGEIAGRMEDDGPWRLTRAMIAGRSLS
jgi:hypothetical protein